MSGTGDPHGREGADRGGRGGSGDGVRHRSTGLRSTDLPPACVPDEPGSCSLCGDEGLVGRVLDVPGGGSVGRVRLERDGRGRETSGERSVALDLLEGVRPGDRVVVHMGFAIARVREEG